MKKHMMSGVLVLGMLLGLSAAPAHAQNDGSKVDLFVGYSYLVNNFSSSSCGSSFSCFDPGNHGYNFSAVWNLNRHVGLEANIAGNHGTTTVFSDVETGGFSDVGKQRADTTSFLFGPKLTYPVMNFDLYTHFLVGALHTHQNFQEACCTATSTPDSETFKGTGFGMKVGGGVDWNHGRWGVRILEVDYVHGSGEGDFSCNSCSGEKLTGTGSVSDISLSTGFIVHFGKP